MSPTIGRVLTWTNPPQRKKTTSATTTSSPSSQPAVGLWVVSGQCVCVVDPRIVLTAAHVCFDGSTPYKIRVLYTPLDASPPQSFRADLIRYSGQMDVAVLLLDIPLGTNSPFRPSPIAPAHLPLFKPLSSVVLVCFPLTIDLLSQPTTAETVVVNKASALLRTPQLLPGAITGVVPKTTRTKQGITRHFSLVCCNYTSFAGCSGGGVFALLSASGLPVLLGVHTEAVFQTERSGVSIASLLEDEFDGLEASAPTRGDAASVEGEEEGEKEGRSSEGSPGASKRQRVSLSPTPSPAAESAVEASPSSTPEDSPIKKMQLRLAGEVQHKAALSVFVVANSALSQHPKWNQAALLADAVAVQAPRSAVATATGDFDVAIVKVEEERSRQTSPRFFADRRAQDELYG